MENQKKNIIYDAVQQKEIEALVAAGGYAYDWKQDIFYTPHDPWQKQFGYCRLYDEAAPAMAMVIDSEPIQFEYDGKRWLIELWKGQYGITTGCEIGVYYTTEPDVEIPGVFTGPLYFGASDEEHLIMFCFLQKNGTGLFSRTGTHWWLTGFVLGEFSEPEELTMIALITLKNEGMCAAFIKALQGLGYSDQEYTLRGTTVVINFSKPHSKQPVTRYSPISRAAQMMNKFNCELYKFFTANMENMYDSLKTIRQKSPVLYSMFLDSTKSAKGEILEKLLKPE